MSKKKPSPKKHVYRTMIDQASEPYQNRLLIGVPMTGSVRAEWVQGRYGQVIPTNWSNVDILHYIDTYAPFQYMVADARNCCVQEAVERGMEWIVFIDHDTIIPPDCFVKLNEYMRSGKYPVVCGLYYTRSEPPEPLVFRGRGTGHYDKWTVGDKVWVDGIPMGCTLIHMSVLRAMYAESEEYRYGNRILRRVFETPNKSWIDPESGGTMTKAGTEDLAWCERVMKEGWLEKSGWGEHMKKHKNLPFLIDTSIFCRHISPEGVQYPFQWRQIQQIIAQRTLKKQLKEIK